jgi:RHH-type rel operon transcriptional repressor/antitoxin RelB
MTYSIRIPKDIEVRLSYLAEKTGRSKSFYIKEALVEHITDLEDIYIAERRLEDIRAGRTKTIPLQEVMKKYDMDC